jgi:hypothetical protein
MLSRWGLTNRCNQSATRASGADGRWLRWSPPAPFSAGALSRWQVISVFYEARRHSHAEVTMESRACNAGDRGGAILLAAGVNGLRAGSISTSAVQRFRR